jgi:hypothetical protein
MGLTNEYPVISSNLKQGYGIFGTADAYNTSLPNNGARNPVGSIAFIPAPSESGQYWGSGNSTTPLATTHGYGSGLWCKYVLYASTTNPAMQAGPAPVFYVDETFTTVSGSATDSLGSATVAPSFCAGWLPLNTGSVTGVGVGSAISATILNNSGNGSYVWLILAGFIPSAYLSAGTTAGLQLSAAASANWSVVATAVGTAAVNKPIGYTLAAPSSNIGDVMACLLPF